MTTYVKECSAYVFLWEFYSNQAYTQVFNPFLIYFHIWCQRMFKFYFTCSCPVFPARICFFICVYFCLLCHRLLCCAQSLSHVQIFMTPWTVCSPPGSSVREDSPGKNIGVGCHAALQGIFPTQASRPGLPHCRQILYHLSHQGSPVIG